MEDMKIKILEEILEHLQNSQGGDLQALIEESKQPKDEEGEAPADPIEGEAEELAEEPAEIADAEPAAEPEGLEEKEMPSGGDEEMSDEEVEELLREHLKG